MVLGDEEVVIFEIFCSRFFIFSFFEEISWKFSSIFCSRNVGIILPMASSIAEIMASAWRRRLGIFSENRSRYFSGASNGTWGARYAQ